LRGRNRSYSRRAVVPSPQAPSSRRGTPPEAWQLGERGACANFVRIGETRPCGAPLKGERQLGQRDEFLQCHYPDAQQQGACLAKEVIFRGGTFGTARVREGSAPKPHCMRSIPSNSWRGCRGQQPLASAISLSFHQDIIDFRERSILVRHTAHRDNAVLRTAAKYVYATNSAFAQSAWS
jgi:hypothetical protein